MKLNFRIWLPAVVCAIAAITSSCTKDVTSNKTPTPPPAAGEKEIDLKMNSYLRTHYLWNNEYNTLKPDFKLEYDEFLSKTLLGMNTNVLDKKLRDGKYKLYSYIERKSPIAASVQWTRGVNNGQAKEAVTDYGFVNMGLITFDNSPDYGLVVSAVYPGSPADKAGVKRGFEILEVDGQAITDDNLDALYNKLMMPGAAQTVVLTENATGLPTKTISSAEYYPNPVLYAGVIQNKNNIVGYLVYSGFVMAYDDELLAAIAELKKTGMTDLVLDLRLNGGGQVPSALMLSTCIAGQAGQGKVFQYYRYNDTRMANPTATGRETYQSYDSSKKWFYESFITDSYYDVDLQPYWLNMNRLYVLTLNGTASASEAVIGSLKGIGFPVTLIGRTTNGKNVGMEPVSLKDADYEYVFAPITFQGYNAKGETVNPQGITPDYQMSDWSNGYLPFGDPAEPLLAKALELNGRVAPKSAAALSTRAIGGVRLADRQLPEVVIRPQGMIQMPPAERAK